MNTAFEAVLATTFFLIIVAFFMITTNTMISSRLTELSIQAKLANASAIASMTRLLLENNYRILDSPRDEDYIASSLEPFLYGISLGGQKLITSQVEISFPSRINVVKEMGTITVYTSPNGTHVMVVRFVEKGALLEEKITPFTMLDLEPCVFIGQGFFAVNRLSKNSLNGILSILGSYGDKLYIVYPSYGGVCVINMTLENDEIAELGQVGDCPSFKIFSEVPARSFIRSLVTRVNKPVVIVYSGYYYAFPDLYPSIKLFEAPPRGSEAVSSQKMAYVNGTLVLIEVRVWD